MALGLVFAAYASEVFAAAFNGIPIGQWEAAAAIGLHRWQTMRLVILPQLIRIALPGLANLWLLLLKDTALVSVIALDDLLRMTSNAVGHTSQPFFFYLVACMIYLAMSIASSFGIGWIERRSERGERGAAPPASQPVAGMNFDLLAALWPELLEGLIVTFELVAISMVLGAILAVPIAAARLSTNRFIGALAFAYVYFFRGTPLHRPALPHLLRRRAIRRFAGGGGALDLLPRGFQLRRSRLHAEHAPPIRRRFSAAPSAPFRAANGKRRARSACIPLPLLWKVVFPQAAMVALRPLGNELILLIKASAIASIVTVLDLMGETRRAFSRSYDLTIYLYAAALYLIMVEAIRRIWNRLEARLTRHLSRDVRTAIRRGWLTSRRIGH